jgi:hypothetical protein
MSMNYQHPGKRHTFPCGCTGILPNIVGKTRQSNWLARPCGLQGWACRVHFIIKSSLHLARAYGHKPINSNTEHSIIRKMMKAKKCWRCKEPLKWKMGLGKTPHLHHSHKTGEILGFTCPRCNPRMLEYEVDKLRKYVQRLKRSVSLALLSRTVS